MKVIRYILGAFVFAFFVAGPVVGLAAPTPASAAINCEPRFLGVPPWYRGMTEVRISPSTGLEECFIKGPGNGPNNVQNYVLKLALNIVEMALVVVGYIALFFLLYGGFQFLTGGANPSQVEKARTTMLNAIIGLAIALLSVGVTNVIFRILG